MPATTGLEISQFDIYFNTFAVRNTVKFAPALFEKEAHQKHDWEILKTIARKLLDLPDDGMNPEMLLDGVLKNGIYGEEGMSAEKLKQHPHGIDLGEMKPCLTDKLQTEDQQIHLAPPFFINDLKGQ